MNPATAKLTSGWQRLAGNRRLFLLCILLFVGSAFFSFWASFPAEILQRRLVREASQQTGLKMQGNNAAILFPLGLELDLRIFPSLPELAPLELKELQLSPVWLSLFSGNPALDLQGELSGGSLDMQANKDGQLSIDFSDVSLAALQKAELPYRIQGVLSGSFAGQQISAAMTGSGEFNLQVQNARLLGLEQFGLPTSLSLGLVTVEGKFNRRRLSFEEILFSDGMIELSGGGTMLVEKKAEKTRLNLNLRLQPTQTTPDSLRDLLRMSGAKPTADGSYLLRLSGSLAQPVLR